MKRFVWVMALFVVIGSIAGCDRIKLGKPAQPKEEGPVLAKVGREVITLSKFNDRIAKLPDNIKPIAENNKAAYLDNLILEILLYEEGLKRRLDRDAETLELLQEAKKKVVIARLAKEEIEDKILIEPNELTSYYGEHKDTFMSPELFRASHILVDTLEEAVEISDKINAGALFEELAKKYSKDVTSKSGGDVGYFSAGQMVPEFEDACTKLTVGEVSGPVKTQFGYHIIKLADKKRPEPLEYDAVKSRIEMTIAAEKRRGLFEELVTRLKAETDVTINNEVLESELMAESQALPQS